MPSPEPSAASRVRVDEVGLHRHQAVCTCGYTGPIRVTPADAEKDGEAHLAGWTHRTIEVNDGFGI